MDKNDKCPKRRKSKDNPYTIYKKNGKSFLSFTDGQGLNRTLKISDFLYDQFNEFELEDLVYCNIFDRHIEHSELTEETLYSRAVDIKEPIEDVVYKNIKYEQLQIAIAALPEIQRRRLILYFFRGFTYEHIAEMEGCSKVAVKYTIDKALAAIKEKIKNSI